MKKKPVFAIALIFIALLLLIGLLHPLFLPNVYAGVSIEGVDVGGKAQDEVRQVLDLWRQEYRSRQVMVCYEGKVFPLSADSIDYDIDVNATTANVWDFGRQGSWWRRLENIYTARLRGHQASLKFRYNEAKLAALIEKWREGIDRPPRNAALSLLNGGIVPQEQGRKLDTAALKSLVFETMQNRNISRVDLPVNVLYPEVSADDIVKTGLREFWASYETYFDFTNANRSDNIRLSACRINGYIVHPGQVFSFNEVVGPRDKEHGFKEALEIFDGEYVPGIGGGVCQVSSTLYNAVLLSGLAVIDRSNHSKPLGYIDIGRDATVAYNVLDFKFNNNTNAPIMILAETADNRLVVGIVGQKPQSEFVELVVVDSKIIIPQVINKTDGTLPAGETLVEKEGKPGYEVTIIRVVRKEGKEIRREKISTDRYLPEDTVIKIGTKPPEIPKESSPSKGAGKNKNIVQDRGIL